MRSDGWRLQAASDSRRGARKANEDAVLSASLSDGRWLAAVADGMGGLRDGEMASRTALAALRNGLEKGQSLVRAVEEANQAVFRQSQGGGMGTTLVAALFDGGRVRIANVGDGRAYLLGRVGLVQVTRDHTHAADAAARGGAAAREVATSRWAGTLTRSLGSGETVEVDEFGPLALEDGIQVLLCSDGVHGVLGDDEIESCLQGDSSPERTVERLLAHGLERGSRDNLSAVVVRCGLEEPSARDADPAPRPGSGTVRRGPGVSDPAGPHARPDPAVREQGPSRSFVVSDPAPREAGANASFERPDAAGPEPGPDEEFELPDPPEEPGPEAEFELPDPPEEPGSETEFELPDPPEEPGPAAELELPDPGPGEPGPDDASEGAPSPIGGDAPSPGTARWDPARLARRAPRSRRRKPGTLRAFLVVLGLAAGVLVMLALLN